MISVDVRRPLRPNRAQRTVRRRAAMAMRTTVARLLLVMVVGSASGEAALAREGGPLAADQPVRLVGHGGPVKAIEVEAGGQRALTSSFDYSVILWSLSGEEGRLLHRLIGHEAAVNDVAFLPGGRRAVSVSDDGALALWDLEKGRLVDLISDGRVKTVDVAISPDGRYAATARWDATARMYDLEDRKEIRRFQGHDSNVNSVAFTPDGAQLLTASYDGTIRLWDLASPSERAGAMDRVLVRHGWGVNVVRPLIDGSIVFGGLDGTFARVASDGEVATIFEAEGPVLAIDLVEADSGGRVAVGSADGRIRIVAVEDWTVVEDHHNPYGPVWGLAFADARGAAVYHTGLDDFAIRWQVAPRRAFEPAEGTFPRRFQAGADATAGERQFLRRCSVCHTLSPDDMNRAGPTLYGLFGRRAGTLPGYPYSEGLRRSQIVWNEKTVGDLFDHGPDIVTPGSKMPLQQIPDEKARRALIAFLKEATQPGPKDSIIKDRRTAE